MRPAEHATLVARTTVVVSGAGTAPPASGCFSVVVALVVVAVIGGVGDEGVGAVDVVGGFETMGILTGRASSSLLLDRAFIAETTSGTKRWIRLMRRGCFTS